MKQYSSTIPLSYAQSERPNILDLVEELCDGKPALINPNTGGDFDCRTGRERCPAGSYCHKVADGAKCCREGE